jgi:uncharacterized protein YodC (DUF2158 family)
MKGGTSLPTLKPDNFNGGFVNNLPSNQNFAKMPNVFPSNQTGGAGYGYSNTSDVAAFGGSYSPITRMCTAGGDVSRGGNNFGMTGGGKRRTIRRTSRKSPTRTSRRYNKSKKSIFSFRNLFSQKLSNNRSRKSRSGGNEYQQKGCSKKNKKGGNAMIVTGGSRQNKNKNKKGGNAMIVTGGSRKYKNKNKNKKGGSSLLVGGSCIAVL